MNGRKGIWAAALLGAVLPQTWFRPGAFIAAGDSGPMLADLHGVTSWWGTQFSGTGSTGYPSAMMPERALLSLVRAVGGSPMLAQRLWFTVVVAVAAAAVAWLAAAFVRRPSAVFAAGAAAVLNPFHITTLPNLLPLIALSCIAVVLGVGARLVHGDHVPALAGVLLAFWCSELARNPPLLALFVVSALVAFGVPLARGAWRAALRVGLAAVVGSLFWVIPVAMHFLFHTPGLDVVAETDPSSWAWTQRHSGPANVVTLVASWVWGDPAVISVTARLARFPWSWLRWALPALAVGGMVLTRRRLLTRVLAVGSVVLVILCVGVNAPFRPINTMLNDLVPGFWLFRQPMSKFGVLLVLCIALAVALAVDDSLRRWRTRDEDPDRAQPLPAVVALAAVAVAFVHPLVIGDVVPGARPYLPSARVTVPESWFDAGTAIDRLPGEGATLVLPMSEYYQRGTVWGYYGVDDIVARVSERPSLFLLPDGYYQPHGASPALMLAAERALLFGDERSFLGAMRSLGTRYLAVRTDVTTAWGRDRTFADGSVVLAAAERMGLSAVSEHEFVTVFEVPTADLFTAADRTVSLITTPSGSADAELAVAAGLADDRTVVARSGVASAPAGAAWIPTAGEAAAVTLVPAGDYDASAVAIGPSLWRATVRGRTVTLVPADRVEANDRTLLAEQTIRLTGAGTPYALLVGDAAAPLTDGRVVPLDGPTLVQVAVGSTVRLLTTSGRTVDFDGVEPGNCNNTDGLPTPASAGIDATAIAAGVVLTAPRDSACVAVPVPAAEPVEGHRRWRLTADFDSSDPGAARTCLWMPSLRRCAAGSRVVPTGTSGSIDVVVDAFGDDVTDARLVLYADHLGARTDPATEVTWTKVRLAPIEATAAPASVPDTVGPAVRVTAGDAGVSFSFDSAEGDLLGTFDNEASDCNRYDDQAANLSVAPLPDERRQPALELSADRHSACVSASLPVEPGVRDLSVSFDYRASDSGVGRVALVDMVSGRTIATERLAPSSFWTSMSFDWHLPAPVVGRDDTFRVYLYADGPGEGANARDVDASFRGLTVVPQVGYAVAALPSVGTPSDGVVRGLDERHVAVAATGDVIVVFHQSYDAGWRLDGLPEGATARHLEVDGWANAWLVRGLDGRSAVLGVSFRGEGVVRMAVWACPAVLLLALLLTDWPAWWRSRRRNARG